MHIMDDTKNKYFTCGFVAYFIFKAKFEDTTNNTTNIAVCFIKLNNMTNFYLTSFETL